MRVPSGDRRRSAASCALVAAGVLCAFAVPAGAAPGDLDETFSRDGIVRTDVGGARLASFDSASTVLVQPDGRIVAVGTSRPDKGNVSRLASARYSSDGSLDPSFDGDGKLLTDACNEPSWKTAAAVQADGALVVADRHSVCRFNPDGSLDTTFSGDGSAAPGFLLSDLALASDGAIVVAGGGAPSNGSESDLTVARLLPDGSLDPSFSGDGVANTDFGASEWANTVLVQPDGKVVVSGGSDSGPNRSSVGLMARYTVAGDPDPSFADGGTLTVGGSSFFESALLPDGRIVASDGDAVHRFQSDGSPDPSLGEAGSFNPSLAPRALAVQPDGKLVLAGSVLRGGSKFQIPEPALARHDIDGSLDSSFGQVSPLVHGPTQGELFSVALQPDGRIVVAGPVASGGKFVLARFEVEPGPPDADADGRLDAPDRCPKVHAMSASGCREGGIRITLRYDRRAEALVGRVSSKRARVCGVDTVVRLFRRRGGRAREVAEEGAAFAGTGRGEFDFSEALGPGRYYAVVRRSFIHEIGICHGARSRTVELDRGERG